MVRGEVNVVVLALATAPVVVVVVTRVLVMSGGCDIVVTLELIIVWAEVVLDELVVVVDASTVDE